MLFNFARVKPFVQESMVVMVYKAIVLDHVVDSIVSVFVGIVKDVQIVMLVKNNGVVVVLSEIKTTVKRVVLCYLEVLISMAVFEVRWFN